MPQQKYLLLGEVLIKEGIISQEGLDKAIRIQQREGGRLGEILLNLGLIKEEQLALALSKQLSIPFASYGKGLLKPTLDQKLKEIIPREYALKNLVIPLSRTLNSLTCAFSDPLDIILIDNLRKLTGCEINPIIATKSDIIKAIEDFYGKEDLLKEAVKESYSVIKVEEEKEEFEETLSLDRLIARAEEAPVVKLVDLIIRQAVNEGASDIHIEPFKDHISLRYRIDGKLLEVPPPAKHLHLPIISRIKILSRLDIAEKRLPQDGAFTVRLEDRVVDLRVATTPTIYGERVTLRILDRSQALLDLNLLGFEPEQLQMFRQVIKFSYGLILLTGPTGSGKTTTLYATLNEIKASSKNILTIEDPVEYRLEGVNQVQVKPEIGLTFSTALRAFLRQDPDIILVGETRDSETAEMCMRAALTGHLVLSTLHTNDAPSAITRLLDIGIEPYLIPPSLLCVVAQRLARKLCVNCKEAYEPNREELGGIKLNSELIYRAKGCPECNHTGYKGRTLVAEVMIMNEKIKENITKDVSYAKIREIARQAGMSTLYEVGLKKVEKGISSLEEVLSVTLGV